MEVKMDPRPLPSVTICSSPRFMNDSNKADYFKLFLYGPFEDKVDFNVTLDLKDLQKEWVNLAYFPKSIDIGPEKIFLKENMKSYQNSEFKLISPLDSLWYGRCFGIDFQKDYGIHQELAIRFNYEK